MENKRVICFDDDVDLLAVVRTILEKEKIIVETYSRSEDYIKKIEAFKPDAVILDVMFAKEDTDGFELCRSIRKAEQFKNLPILMLSAINDYYPCDFTPHPEFLPCDYFLQKPIEPDKLIGELRKIFSGEK